MSCTGRAFGCSMLPCPGRVVLRVQVIGFPRDRIVQVRAAMQGRRQLLGWLYLSTYERSSRPVRQPLNRAARQVGNKVLAVGRVGYELTCIS